MTDVLTAEADTLFSPLKVGRRTLRNRIINSGHGTSLGPGTHNEDLLAYEARRAEGGAAVVITQANAVSPGAGDFYALYDWWWGRGSILSFHRRKRRRQS